jgi:hypothetical protein
MNQLVHRLLSAVELSGYSLREPHGQSVELDRQAVYEVFELEARAEAARVDESPLVKWAKCSTDMTPSAGGISALMP